MDIARKPTSRPSGRRWLYGAGAVALLALLWLGLRGLEPAARSVDADTLWIGTVERGELVREVRGPGILVPEESRWLAAVTEARVDRILLEAGASVEPETVILELSNPTVELAARDAELALLGARADLQDLRVRLQSELLNHRADAAAAEADLQEAQLEVEANRELSRNGLISELDLRRSEIRLTNLEVRNRIEAERLQRSGESVEAQLGSADARLSQVEALARLRSRELDALRVRSPLAGILQQISVEEGQQVSPGTNLARVAEPGRLKAELSIAEAQVQDLQVGQPARIDTRNGIVPARVIRIDPTARAGSVLVEARLEGELPRGTRPQQSVDGTIELERLEDVLHVGRPVRAAERATLGIFKIAAGGNEAELVQVEFGSSSTDQIEVVSGLEVGDSVILSDMTRYADDRRVRLK